MRRIVLTLGAGILSRDFELVHVDFPKVPENYQFGCKAVGVGFVVE